MTTNYAVTIVPPEDIVKWREKQTPFFLIHTLNNDHYRRAHLPGALNARVFEVTFLDQVAAITDDKKSDIVLYGSSRQSQDARAAAEKLLRAGYQSVCVLEGGLEAWRSRGYPLEGESTDRPGDSQTLLALEDGHYTIDTAQSIIEWAGRNPNTKHHGTVRIAEGRIQIAGGVIQGPIGIDMDSIENISLQGDALQPVLVSHLKSDDFFFAKVFPTATFDIVEGRPVATPYLSLPNYRISGKLKMRGVEADLAFAATITRMEDGSLSAEAHFDIDRTQWKIIYGSTRFFEHLGMHMVFDLISLQLKIVAH